MTYTFSAIVTLEDKGYSVRFPDIDGCITCGETLSEAVDNAEDALCLMLADMEECGEEIPEPSDTDDIKTGKNETIVLISCDTNKYRE
jgi:predicted RNase H-like HicB family nuclease